MKSISIIIISFNRPDDTLDLLKDITLFKNTELLEKVIILNNCSTEDYTPVNSFIDAHSHIPFQYINAPENLGVSRGRNYASRFAEGDILFYLDDDVNLKDIFTLPKLIEAFEDKRIAERQLGVVSFKVLYTTTMQMQVTAFPHKKFKKYKNKHQFLTAYYAGCAHAKLKSAWKDAGNYPENFFYGMEEYDFSYRVLNAGYYIKYDDAIVVLHKESPLGRNTKVDKLKMMWVNKSVVAWRYLPKIFFYTTAIMWSLEFLLKTKFNMPNFIKGWKQILKIHILEKRTQLYSSTLKYLKETEARLWY